MFKKLSLALCAITLAVGFTACSDDETTSTPSLPARGTDGFYVINQGSLYSGIDGTISTISFAGGDTTVTNNAFSLRNNRSLGSTPQKPVIYGSKMYVPMFNENIVWVLNADDLSVITSVRSALPEALCSAEGYVYVAGNDGNVTRIDTLTNAVVDTTYVGPNPMGIAATSGKVYVSISDAYGTYDNGRRVRVLDAKTNQFVENSTIAVGTNPTQVETDRFGNVFVVCMGDYMTERATVWKIDATTGQSAEFCYGSLIATNSQNRTSRSTQATDALYVIDHSSLYSSDWMSTIATYFSSAIYNTSTGEKVVDSIFPDDQKPPSPSALDVNPRTGDVYVCTDASTYGYSEDGLVMVYDGSGKWLHTYNVGVHPYGVVFK